MNKLLAPLRRVVDRPGLKEVLECGHIVNEKQDIYGYTWAARRRCRKCLNGRPLDTEPVGNQAQGGTPDAT